MHLVKSLLVDLGEDCSEMLNILAGERSWSVSSCMCSHVLICLYMFVWEWFNLNTIDACLCFLICIPAHGISMHSQGWTSPAGVTVWVVIWLEHEKFLLYVGCNTGEDLLTRELPCLKEWKRGSDGNGSDVPFRMARLSNDIRQGTYCVAQHECQRTAVCPVTTPWKVVLVPGASVKVTAF